MVAELFALAICQCTAQTAVVVTWGSRGFGANGMVMHDVHVIYEDDFYTTEVSLLNRSYSPFQSCVRFCRFLPVSCSAPHPGPSDP